MFGATERLPVLLDFAKIFEDKASEQGVCFGQGQKGHLLVCVPFVAIAKNLAHKATTRVYRARDFLPERHKMLRGQKGKL